MTPAPRRPDPTQQAAALLSRGRPTEALALAERAAARDAKNPTLQQILALCRSAMGEHERAVFHGERAVTLAPKDAGAHNALAQAALAAGNADLAVKHAERATALRPDTPELLELAGLARKAAGDRVSALAALERAAALPNARPSIAVNLGQLLQELGRAHEAVDVLRAAAERTPAYADAHRRLGLALIHDDRSTGEDIRAAHAAWGRLAEATVPESPPARTTDRDRDRDRPLTVAYLSPDFRAHSVASFIEPLLTNHTPDNVRTLGYSTVAAPDDVTDRLRGLCAGWRDLSRASDADLAKIAAEDHVDILVELSGHFARHRLPALARRIAPVQVTYLGYPATTGLTRIDARLVDAVTDPPELGERWSTERPVRLDPCFLCYGGPHSIDDNNSPSLEPTPPAVRTGTFTFGSFNTLAKLGPAVLDAWATILGRCPTAALRLKGYGFDDPGAVEGIVSGLVARGVARDRIVISPRTAGLAEHLAMYHDIDLALDPFPYNGTTTTCEAAWMGVPTLTFAGGHHAARVGASINAAIGLEQFTAPDAAGYVDRAVELAGQPNELADLRPALRDRMRTSPLMDAAHHARTVEAGYRSLWHDWLDRTAPPG